MYIGVGRVYIYIPESRSLKDRRKVVKSLCSKIENRFNVSISDVGEDLTLKKEVEIGFSVVSNNETHAKVMLESIIEFIEERCNCEIQHYDIEVISGDMLFGNLCFKNKEELYYEKEWPIKVDKNYR